MTVLIQKKVDSKKLKENINSLLKNYIYKNRNIVVYFNEEKVKSTYKRVLAPGEMELVVLKQAELKNFKDLKTIVIKTEEKQ